jgi:hypothetical protein
MALRLDLLVVDGELRNTEHYSTRGSLHLVGAEHEMYLELTGNCGPSLAGKRIRFTARPELQRLMLGDDSDAGQTVADLGWLAWQQVGPTGTMELREVKTFECSVVEFARRSRLDEPPPVTFRPALYLEWFSQNGRVVVELVDPEIETLAEGPLPSPEPGAHLNVEPSPLTLSPLPERRDLPDEQLPWSDEISADEADQEFRNAGLGITQIRLDDDGTPSVDEYAYPAKADDEDSSEAELFTSQPPQYDELQAQFDRDAAALDDAILDDGDEPDYMRELRLMDQALERRTGDLLWDLVEGIETFPPAASLGEADAEAPLKVLLAQLAAFGISVHVCPHYTPWETYRWLMEDILPEEIGQREFRRTQWVQGFDTGESSCPACQAEFEREYEESKRHRRESPDEREPPSE